MIITIIIIVLIYLFFISTRKCKTIPKSVEPNLYAHRGLHDNINFPFENTLEAFRLAVENGYGIELDVQFTRDKQIVVVHDNNIKRVCGIDKKVSDCTYEELKSYPIFDGSYIPLFSEVLELVSGKVPLLIEIKHYSDVKELSEKTYEMLKNYNGDYCIESFHPLALLWFRKNAPEVFRGQLASGHIDNANGAKYFEQLFLLSLLCNVISAPHFISYTSEHDNNLSMFLIKKIFKPKLAAFTLKNQEELDRALEKGYTMPIFEGFIPKLK